MIGIEQQRRVEKFIVSAVEVSYDVAPNDFGLTLDELVAVGEKLDLLRGEMTDSVGSGNLVERADRGRWVLSQHAAHLACWFVNPPRPWRKVRAFDYVIERFLDLRRKVGETSAKIGRDALLAQATADGLDSHEVAVALALFVAGGAVETRSGVLTLRPTYALGQLPSKNLRHRWHGAEEEGEYMQRLLQLVRDVIGRRTDGRRPAADPLVAFEAEMALAGLAGYQVWWRHTVGELRLINPQVTPTAAIVLCAALAEAALSVVARRAAATGKTMTSDVLTKAESHWKLHELIKAAKRGTPPLLDGELGAKCEHLNEIRQRIHLGKFIAARATPDQLDIRGEDAHTAVEILGRLVEAILAWTSRHAS